MNENEERTVRAVLARVADELPPGGVPTDRLVTDGERALLRRRAAALGAVAMVTTLALLGVAMLVRPGTARRPAPADSATPSGPSAVAPERFDPRRQPFRLGSLPPNVGHESYETDVRMVTVRAAVPDAISPGGPVEPGPIMAFAGTVTVRMGARGVDVFFNQRELAEMCARPPVGGVVVAPGRCDDLPAVPLPGEAVAPVAGHPAFRYTHNGETLLSWQYAPDGWISVEVSRYDRPEQLARQIAEDLIWEERPVTVPLAPVAAPAGMVLNGTEVDTFRGKWLDADLRYVLPENVGSAKVRSDVMLGVSNGIFAGDGSDFTSGLTVAGRRAMASEGPRGMGAYRVAQMPGGCTGCVAEVDSETAAGKAALGGRTGALDLAASIRLVNGWDDPAAWRPV